MLRRTNASASATGTANANRQSHCRREQSSPGESAKLKAQNEYGVDIANVQWSANVMNGTYTAPSPKAPDSPADMVTVTAKDLDRNLSGSATITLIHATVTISQDAVALKPGATVHARQT